MKKAVFTVLGFIFFALAAIGVFLPVLPTTPFLMLAAACFTRASTKFERWFKGTRLYKNHLDAFVKERAMTLKNKVRICTFASTMLLIALILVQNSAARVFIASVIFAKYYYFIFRIRTIKPMNQRAMKKGNCCEDVS